MMLRLTSKIIVWLMISLEGGWGKYVGPPIFYGAQVTVNDTIYLVQGSRIDPHTQRRTVLDQLLILDTYKDFQISESPWEEESLDQTIPALDSTACSLFKPNSTTFLCIGGKYQDSSLQFNDGSPTIYDTVTRTWSSAIFSTNDLPPNRFGHTMAPLPDGSGIILFGGANPATSLPLSDFWHLSSLRKWEPLKTSGVPPSYYHTMSIVTTPTSYKIVVIGGKQSENKLAPTDTVLVYHHETETWITQEVRFPIVPRHSHSAVVYGKHIIVFGGTNVDSTLFYSDIVSLDTEKWEWSTLFSSDGIAGRYGHTSACFGNLMLIFFGKILTWVGLLINLLGLTRSLESQTYIFNLDTRRFVSHYLHNEAFPPPPSSSPYHLPYILAGSIGGTFLLLLSLFFLIRHYLKCHPKITSFPPASSSPPLPSSHHHNDSFLDLPIESGLEDFSCSSPEFTPSTNYLPPTSYQDPHSIHNPSSHHDPGSSFSFPLHPTTSLRPLNHHQNHPTKS